MAPEKLSSFSCILQSEFLLNNTAWSYRIPEMPKHRGTGWVKTLDLISNTETQKLELKFSKLNSN
jgi:hypothetical protein